MDMEDDDAIEDMGTLSINQRRNPIRRSPFPHHTFSNQIKTH